VNPARSFGPALVVGGTALSQVWLFIVAPLVGVCSPPGCADVHQDRGAEKFNRKFPNHWPAGLAAAIC
jgi:major intrinsic protein